MATSDPNDRLPLTEPAREILLALAGSDLHGYAIMQEVARRTDGQVTLHPGTLYRAIARLVTLGYVEEPTTGRAAAREDARRRYYRLTRLGRSVLAAEIERLDRQISAARLRLAGSRPGAGS